MNIALVIGETYITRNNTEVKIVDTKTIDNKTVFIGLYNDKGSALAVLTPKCLLFYPDGKQYFPYSPEYNIIMKKPKISYAVVLASFLFSTKEEANRYAQSQEESYYIREIER